MTIANKIELTAAFWGIISGLLILATRPITDEDLQRWKTHANKFVFLIGFFASCVLLLTAMAMYELWKTPVEPIVIRYEAKEPVIMRWDLGHPTNKSWSTLELP